MATAEVAPAYAPEDPTLPKPWTGLIDSSTGVLYYWNPETNATQYEKPASLPPPSAAAPLQTSRPNLAPIPTIPSQMSKDTTSLHESGRQMLQRQPINQLSNQQTQPLHQLSNPQVHYQNQPTHQYPNMQTSQMAHPQFPNTNEQGSHYQVQQQQGLVGGDHQRQQNGFAIERDMRRQTGPPMGFPASSAQQNTGPPNGHQYPVFSHGPRTADYTAQPEQHVGRTPSSGNGGVFNEMPQVGPDHHPRPLCGPASTNHMGNMMSQPFMGQNMRYNEEQNGRGRNDSYPSRKEGPGMSQPPQAAIIPHPGNQQDTRMLAITQSMTSGHSGVNSETTMSKMAHAAFPHAAPMGGASDLKNIRATDSYCQHHEITVTGDNVPAPFMTFEAAGFAPEILREMRYLLQRRAYVVGCAAIYQITQHLLCP